MLYYLYLFKLIFSLASENKEIQISKLTPNFLHSYLVGLENPYLFEVVYWFRQLETQNSIALIVVDIELLSSKTYTIDTEWVISIICPRFTKSIALSYHLHSIIVLENLQNRYRMSNFHNMSTFYINISRKKNCK